MTPQPRASTSSSGSTATSSSSRPAVRELDVVARWLWLAWRLVLFCALLSSPMPLSRGQPSGLLRLQQALRQLRRAVPSLDSQRAETPYPFRPEDGELLRPGYQAKYGVRGEALVGRLGGEYLGPKEYLTPPPAPRAPEA